MTIPNVNIRDEDARNLGGDVSEDTADPVNEHAWSLQDEKYTPEYPTGKYAPKYDVQR